MEYCYPHRVTSPFSPQLCGDNANCIFDAILAGEDVGQATLEAEEADRAFQEEVGGEKREGDGDGVVGVTLHSRIPAT